MNRSKRSIKPITAKRRLLFEHSQLVDSPVFLLLMLNVISYRFLVTSYCRNKVPARPKALARIVSTFTSVVSRNMDRTLSLYESNYLRD